MSLPTVGWVGLGDQGALGDSVTPVTRRAIEGAAALPRLAGLVTA